MKELFSSDLVFFWHHVDLVCLTRHLVLCPLKFELTFILRETVTVS